MAIFDPDTTDPTYRGEEAPTQQDWVVGTASSAGLTRQENQDAYWADPNRGFAIADGIGGRPGGGLAASTAIRSFADRLEPQSSMGDTLAALAAAENDVLASRQAAGLDNAGTTFVALTATRLATCTVVWCGDSRLYRFRDGGLELLTVDHSLENELLAETGRGIGQSSLRGLPLRALTRYMGVESDFEPDMRILVPKVGDRYLLCSDGVHGQLSARVIGDVLASATCAGAATALVGLADLAGGHDNATAVVADAIG